MIYGQKLFEQQHTYVIEYQPGAAVKPQMKYELDKSQTLPIYEHSDVTHMYLL